MYMGSREEIVAMKKMMMTMVVIVIVIVIVSVDAVVIAVDAVVERSLVVTSTPPSPLPRRPLDRAPKGSSGGLQVPHQAGVGMSPRVLISVMIMLITWIG